MNLIKDQIIKDDNIIAFYDYGSWAYGTVNEKSDHDIIAVVKDKTKLINSSINEVFDISVYSEDEFKNLILSHEISILECLFLNEDKIWKEKEKWDFQLNLSSLRHSFSEKSSNSWVKAKKKFIVEKDFNEYIGKKSAWHSIRIMDFGIQIAKNGKIVDYTSCNKILNEIIVCNDWDEINSQFKNLLKEKSSEFKQLAPKEIMVKKMAF